jgi:membrane dipeptidase
MSHQAMMDVATISQKPILNSHSNLMHFLSHPRNVQDEFLKVLAKNGGVLGLSFCKSFMTKESTLSMDHYFQQIDYVRNLIGDEHIALGTDYHGLTHEDIIDGYDNISSLKAFRQLMIDRYGESFSNKFLYANAQRVLKSHLS